MRDGNVWTSAGVTAGMDLALALVDDDLGRDVALMTARQLVLFVQRPGGQAQFSAQLGAQVAERDPLRELQAWIAEHPDEDHAVERLAARVAMSPRHFARVFRAEVGCTPAAYVETVRVEVARRLLETTGSARRRHRARRRLRHARDDAARVRPPGRRQPDRVPRPLPPRSGPSLKEETAWTSPAHLRRLTALDTIGPYEVLQRLPGAEVKFVAAERGPVRTDQGCSASSPTTRSTRSRAPTSSSCPAASARARSIEDEPTLEWIRAIDASSTWTTSVCTGSMLLGAAGLLEGK